MATISTGFDTTTTKHLLRTGTLRKLFDTTKRETVTFSNRMWNMLTSKDKTEYDHNIAGLTYPGEIQEGQNIPLQTPSLGSEKTYTQRIWGTGFRMTEMMEKLNKYKLWTRWASDLGRVHVEAKDVELAVPWNSPTSTSLTCGTGFDSLAIANNTHTGLLSGSTSDNYDNYGNEALSITALQNARYYFKTMVDDNGHLMGASPDCLYFEPTLYYTAHEIFGSAKEPYSADHTKNVTPQSFGGSVELFEYPRLTSTTAWGMLAKKHKKYDFNVFTAKEPTMYTKDAPDNTIDKVIIGNQWFTYGWGDPRMAYIGRT